MDVASRIRAQLADGTGPGDIVARLVADGMTEANARRIVDKIVAERTHPPTQAHAGRFSNGFGQLVGGALALSLGSAITAFTYALAKPGGKYMLAYGAILGGIASIWKGLKEFEPVRGPFPTMPFVLALLLPVVAFGGLYEWRRPLTREELAERARKEEAREEQARKDAEAVALADAKVRGARIIADHRKLMQGIVDAHERAIDPNPAVRCEGARFFKDNKISDEGGYLERMLESDPEPAAQRCALDAMLASGRDALAILRVLERLERYPSYRPLVVHGYTELQNDRAHDVQARARAGLERLK